MTFFICFLTFQLIGGLADEKGRWQESVEKLSKVVDNIIGDVLISAGTVAYLGPFTVSTNILFNIASSKSVSVLLVYAFKLIRIQFNITRYYHDLCKFFFDLC